MFDEDDDQEPAGPTPADTVEADRRARAALYERRAAAGLDIWTGEPNEQTVQQIARTKVEVRRARKAAEYRRRAAREALVRRSTISAAVVKQAVAEHLRAARRQSAGLQRRRG